MTDSASPGIFVWHDLMTPDVEAAKAFYTKVAPWDTQAWDGSMPYTMWTANGNPIGGVMALPPDAGAPPHWLAYVSTADVDATARRAEQLGARVMVPPSEIPNVGRFAVLSDPQGAAFAIYASAHGAPPPPDAPRAGEFSWHELTTTDHASAMSFYESLFGWNKTSAMDMGEMGPYQMFGVGDVPFGGVMNMPPGMPGPPAWLHYIHVDDVNRVVDVVKSLGGQVLNGPMEVPGGDWIAQCMDPQGGMFAIHSQRK